LPVNLQSIIEVVANVLNESTLAEFNARNNMALKPLNMALKPLVEEHNVQLRQFLAEVMLALKLHKNALIKKQVKADKYFARV
jgi:TRAP-type mannitol/chloroaromatic compound transport system substrate-binding protein